MSRFSRLSLSTAAVGAAFFTALAPGVALATGGDEAKGGGGSDKVTICHATGSESNPFVSITIAPQAVVNAHIDHQHDEDIIPPFTYKGETYSQNWDAAGQAIYKADCKVKTGPVVPADGNGLGTELILLGSLPIAAGAVMYSRRRQANASA